MFYQQQQYDGVFVGDWDDAFDRKLNVEVGWFEGEIVEEVDEFDEGELDGHDKGAILGNVPSTTEIKLNYFNI